MDLISFYKYAYRELDKCYPLPIDCGTLCDKKCCSGDLGMILFPSEELMFLNSDEFDLKESNILIENSPLYLLTCNGNCDRSKRPLACRIFPLIPILNNETILIEYDLKGDSICPLIYSRDLTLIENSFKNMVKDIMQKGLVFPQIKEYLTYLSETQKALARFI